MRSGTEASERSQEVCDKGAEGWCHGWVILRGWAARLGDAPVRGGSVGTVDRDRLDGCRTRLVIGLVAGEACHQVGGLDGLEDAEGIEGVLLFEPVGPVVSLLESLADLDGLGCQQRSWARHPQLDGAGCRWVRVP